MECSNGMARVAIHGSFVGIAAVIAALMLGGCNKEQTAKIDGLRIEPTIASLRQALESNEGQMLPLYVGEERRLLSVFVEDGRLYHCMAKANVVVDKATCRGDQPFSGVSVNLETMDNLGAPCLGGEVKDAAGSPMMLAVCASPHPGINESRGIQQGQLIYIVQMPSGGQIFTFEPVRRPDGPSAAAAALSSSASPVATAAAASVAGDAGSVSASNQSLDESTVSSPAHSEAGAGEDAASSDAATEMVRADAASSAATRRGDDALPSTQAGTVEPSRAEVANSAPVELSLSREAEFRDAKGYGYAVVRTAPSNNAEVIEKVGPGDVFYSEPQAGDWWKVRTSSGQTGFMEAESIRLR